MQKNRKQSGEEINIFYQSLVIKLIQTNLYRLFMMSQQTYAKSEQKQKNDNRKLVNIYLRQTTKFGSKIVIQNKITVKQIMKLAQSEFKIPLEKQNIFFGSKKYHYYDDIELNFQQGAIVHVHNIQQQNFTQLSIFLQQITKQGSISKPVQYKVQSDQKINDFIKLSLQKRQIFMVESGRKLDQQQSFKTNQICNGATITFSSNSGQLNHDQFQKDFNKLFQQEQSQEQQKSKKQLEKSMDAKAKEWRKKKIQSKTKIINEQSSSDQMETFTSKPNFKKKKLICLKAVKTNPEDNSYIWKRDHSFSQSKCQKIKLRKAIKTKKKKQPQKVESSKPQNEQMSKKAKLRLKQQIQKLFMSDNLGLKEVNENKKKILQFGQKAERMDSSPIQICKQKKTQEVY